MSILPSVVLGRDIDEIETNLVIELDGPFMGPPGFLDAALGVRPGCIFALDGELLTVQASLLHETSGPAFWTVVATRGTFGTARTVHYAGIAVENAITGGLGGGTETPDLNAVLGVSSGQWAADAITAASSAMSTNPFATMADLTAEVVLGSSEALALSAAAGPGPDNAYATINDLPVGAATAAADIHAAGTLTDLIGAMRAAALMVQVVDSVKIDQPPTNAIVDEVISPAVTVLALDDLNNLCTRDNGRSVVVALTTPGGATLGGTLVQPTVAGVATFDDLTVDTADTGYTLTATSGILQSSPSSTFDITTGEQ